MDAECKDLETLRIGRPGGGPRHTASNGRARTGTRGAVKAGPTRDQGRGGGGQWGAARVPPPPLPPTCQSKHRNLAHFLPQMEAL